MFQQNKWKMFYFSRTFTQKKLEMKIILAYCGVVRGDVGQMKKNDNSTWFFHFDIFKIFHVFQKICQNWKNLKMSKWKIDWNSDCCSFGQNRHVSTPQYAKIIFWCRKNTSTTLFGSQLWFGVFLTFCLFLKFLTYFQLLLCEFSWKIQNF